MDLFDLQATLKLNRTDYDKGLSDAEESAKGFGGKLSSALGTATKVGVAAGAAMAAGVGLAGKAFVGSAKDVAAYGDTIDKNSQKMNLSATAYQEWDFVLQHCGSSIDSLKPSMKTLANAAETNSDAFQKLGLSQQDVAGMSQEQLFSATIKGLQNVKDDTERTYLAGQLLGRGATELGPLLNMSAEETANMKQQVHDLGGVMSDDGVKASAQFQDSLQNMQTAASGMKNNLMVQFLPGLSTVMDGMADIFAGKEGGTEKVTKGLTDLIENIKTVLPDLIKNILPPIITALVELLPVVLETVISSIGIIIQTLIPLLPELISGIFTALKDALAPLLDVIREKWEDIKTAISDKWEEIKTAISDKWEEIKTAISDKITAIKDGVTEKFETIKTNIKDKIEDARDRIREAVDKIKGFLSLSGLAEKVKTTFTNIKDRALEPVRNLREKIREIIDKIKGFFNFTPNLPHIKLPHISVNPSGWSIGDIFKGVIPSLGISWYDKGGVFYRPSVIGVGENRPEFVGALDDLRAIVREESNVSKSNVFNFYIQGDDPKAIAEEVKAILTTEIDQKARAWA